MWLLANATWRMSALSAFYKQFTTRKVLYWGVLSKSWKMMSNCCCAFTSSLLFIYCSQLVSSWYSPIVSTCSIASIRASCVVNATMVEGIITTTCSWQETVLNTDKTYLHSLFFILLLKNLCWLLCTFSSFYFYLHYCLSSSKFNVNCAVSTALMSAAWWDIELNA